MVFSYEHLISKSDEVHTPLNQVSKKQNATEGLWVSKWEKKCMYLTVPFR